MSWGSQGRKDFLLQGNCASPRGSLSVLMSKPLRSPASIFSLGSPVLDAHICTCTPNSQHFGTGDPWQHLLKSKLPWARWHHREQQFVSGNGWCEHIPIACSGDSVRGNAGRTADPTAELSAPSLTSARRAAKQLAGRHAGIL